MAKITELQKYARAKKAKQAKTTAGKSGNGTKAANGARASGAKSGAKDIDHFNAKRRSASTSATATTSISCRITGA